MSKRRRFAGELKAKIALKALRGDRTLQEIASKHQVHSHQVSAWKRQAIDGLGEVFCTRLERHTDQDSIHGVPCGASPFNGRAAADAF